MFSVLFDQLRRDNELDIVYIFIAAVIKRTGIQYLVSDSYAYRLAVVGFAELYCEHSVICFRIDSHTIAETAACKCITVSAVISNALCIVLLHIVEVVVLILTVTRLYGISNC